LRITIVSTRQRGEVRILDPQSVARGSCGGHVAVHGRDKYLNLLACGGVALGSQQETSAASNWRRDASTCVASKQQLKDRIMAPMDFFNQKPVVHTWTPQARQGGLT